MDSTPPSIRYVTDEELEKEQCLCGGVHSRDDYEQLPCRWNGFLVERSYRCPEGFIVSWCKMGAEGISYGKL